MILETATFTVVPGTEEDFIAAVEKARDEILSQAAGFAGITIHRGIERPHTIMLALRWERLEDHTEGFRGGPLFGQWRERISPFFGPEAPSVEHWNFAGEA